MRIARAAALSVILCWVSITPSPALAQLQLGSLVVNITSPASGSTVSGSIAVSAGATIIGSLTVAGVQLKLDRANLGAEDTSAPYAATWHTTSTAIGPPARARPPRPRPPPLLSLVAGPGAHRAPP